MSDYNNNDMNGDNRIWHDDGWSPYRQQPQQPAPQPKPAKQKVKAWKVIVPIIVSVAVIAASLGAGYFGATLAAKNIEPQRVVINQSDNTQLASESTTEETQEVKAKKTTASDGTELSSEEVAAKVMDSVVAITTEEVTTSNYWFGNQVTSGAGSGVIISADGYIVTNNHVISGATTITVELSDKTKYEAEVVGTYPDGDLAVIKIDAEGLSPATFADSDEVVQGTTVYAVGNPEGEFSGSISSGIISALDRIIQVQQEAESEDTTQNNSPWSYYFGYGNGTTSSYITVTLKVFQFDAAVSPGNSGGGLFNAQGELIGIVCAKSSGTNTEGLSFAIVGNNVKNVAESLIETGSYTPSEEELAELQQEDEDSGVTTNTNKAVLGITAIQLTEEQAAQYNLNGAGVYINSVTVESTREAGLESGDRIISIDGSIVTETQDVVDYLADSNPGDVVTVLVERDGHTLSVDVTLVENTTVQ